MADQPVYGFQPGPGEIVVPVELHLRREQQRQFDRLDPCDLCGMNANKAAITAQERGIEYAMGTDGNLWLCWMCIREAHRLPIPPGVSET